MTSKQRVYGINVICALLLTLGATTQAETIQIPVGQQGQANKDITRPRAGMKQDQVKAQYGNPMQWSGPVGEPPISKWFYQNYIVVFEYDTVLHTILNPTPQPATTTVATSNTVQPSTSQPRSTADAQPMSTPDSAASDSMSSSQTADSSQSMSSSQSVNSLQGTTSQSTRQSASSSQPQPSTLDVLRGISN